MNGDTLLLIVPLSIMIFSHTLGTETQNNVHITYESHLFSNEQALHGQFPAAQKWTHAHLRDERCEASISVFSNLDLRTLCAPIVDEALEKIIPFCPHLDEKLKSHTSTPKATPQETASVTRKQDESSTGNEEEEPHEGEEGPRRHPSVTHRKEHQPTSEPTDNEADDSLKIQNAEDAEEEDEADADEPKPTLSKPAEPEPESDDTQPEQQETDSTSQTGDDGRVVALKIQSADDDEEDDSDDSDEQIKSRKPTAVLVSDPMDAKIDTVVRFDASQSRCGEEGACRKFEWDFGDGTYTEPTTQPFTNHSYREAKDYYKAVVTVTDERGRTAHAYVLQKIYAEIFVSFTRTPDVSAKQNVIFDASASHDAYGRPLHWFKWDFGDDTEETQWLHHPQTTHVYNKPGRYRVKLIVRCHRTGQLANKIDEHVVESVTEIDPEDELQEELDEAGG